MLTPQHIMGYINSGKEQGATVHLGGHRHGQEGYFIQPIIFTDARPDMKIVQEGISVLLVLPSSLRTRRM